MFESKFIHWKIIVLGGLATTGFGLFIFYKSWIKSKRVIRMEEEKGKEILAFFNILNFGRKMDLMLYINQNQKDEEM